MTFFYDTKNGEILGRYISIAIVAVVTGGGYHLGRRLGLWTSRRRVFYFLWLSFAAPLLFLTLDIGIEESWIGAVVVFFIAMLTAGPAGAFFGSIWPFTADNRPKKKTAPKNTR